VGKFEKVITTLNASGIPASSAIQVQYSLFFFLPFFVSFFPFLILSLFIAAHFHIFLPFRRSFFSFQFYFFLLLSPPLRPRSGARTFCLVIINIG
jgi:hypothetical protein